MKVLFLVGSLLLVGTTSNAFAGNCTAWTAQSGTTCVLAGQDATFYERQCDNPCWAGHDGLGNYGPGCDLDQICSLEDPSSFDGGCSDWIQEDGTTCYDPGSNDWEQRWERACTVGTATSACSADTPTL